MKQGVLAEFEARFHLLLDPLLVAVRFYELAFTPPNESSFISIESSVESSTESSSSATVLASVKAKRMKLASVVFEKFVNITPVVDLPHLKELAVNMISNVLSNSETQKVTF